MSAEHKAALAQGRTESKAVRQYLEALESHKPKRGRQRTPDSIKRRLEKIDEDLKGSDPLRRLQMEQERLNLQAELGPPRRTPDLSSLEKGFVRSARAYSERKGISYAAWRKLDVPPRSAQASRHQPGLGALARASTDSSNGSPSAEPNNWSEARSGWGMSPTTLPLSLQTPAMSSIDPFGLTT